CTSFGYRIWCFGLVSPTTSCFRIYRETLSRFVLVKVIADKGTPFADLLVPKLTASVTDGAVGVTVDARCR
ncbi:hypothetical protein ABLN73_05890, partial [Mycobacterium tuberculosis]